MLADLTRFPRPPLLVLTGGDPLKRADVFDLVDHAASLGLDVAMTPSATLANVIGSSPMPRTEVTKKIWDYIKKNKLQDSINRRLINADEKLRAVFGGKGKVSMFEMTKLVSNHLK